CIYITTLLFHNFIKLNERIYQCSKCGLIIDRDYNYTLNGIYYGTKTQKFKKLKIPVDRRVWKIQLSTSSFRFCTLVLFHTANSFLSKS
ncbi:MAG: hypothetical protein M1462_03460, partial [Candidatus Thermoplasmatota archaeon]|nr:hypothetical protein [Candidatus Thermoplasmatota archaeon]